MRFSFSFCVFIFQKFNQKNWMDMSPKRTILLIFIIEKNKRGSWWVRGRITWCRKICWLSQQTQATMFWEDSESVFQKHQKKELCMPDYFLQNSKPKSTRDTAHIWRTELPGLLLMVVRLPTDLEGASGTSPRVELVLCLDKDSFARTVASVPIRWLAPWKPVHLTSSKCPLAPAE